MDATADAPAVSLVPVITTAEPGTEAGSQPYTTHTWKWRGHKIRYAVRLEFCLCQLQPAT